jgi:hypothetical protein
LGSVAVPFQNGKLPLLIHTLHLIISAPQPYCIKAEKLRTDKEVSLPAFDI